MNPVITPKWELYRTVIFPRITLQSGWSYLVRLEIHKHLHDKQRYRAQAWRVELVNVNPTHLTAGTESSESILVLDDIADGIECQSADDCIAAVATRIRDEYGRNEIESE